LPSDKNIDSYIAE